MGLNSTEVSYGFGQMGSGYLDDTGALTPPAGSVIVAIQVVSAAKFTTLTADTSLLKHSTAGLVADGSDGTAFIGTGTQVAVNGTNSEAIAAADEFPTGITIYGRWTACTLAAGKVIVYYGPETHPIS
tara:strand:- start:1026 stop:1409 length:384 start_codon:yes stop_codon:yes gene_type:complete